MDYIKRSDALNFDMSVECKPDELLAAMEGMARVLDYIKAIPAADVEPVVRCKDCKYYKSRNDGVVQCTRFRIYTAEDDFCSSGRRC